MTTTIKKLAEIQQGLHAPKDRTGAGVRYDYRNIEDIIKAAKPLLSATGTALTMSDEILFIEGRFYLKATARLIDAETGAVIAENSAFAREPDRLASMSEPQVTGSASSYARKYALCGLLAVDGTVDDGVKDPDEIGAQPKPAPPKQGVSPSQANPGNQQVQPAQGVPSNKAILRNALAAAGVTGDTVNWAVQTITSRKRQTWKDMTEADCAYLVNEPGIWNEALALLKAKGVIQ